MFLTQHGRFAQGRVIYYRILLVIVTWKDFTDGKGIHNLPKEEAHEWLIKRHKESEEGGPEMGIGVTKTTVTKFAHFRQVVTN